MHMICQAVGGGLLTGIDKVGYVLLRYYWTVLWLSSRLRSVFRGILCVFGGILTGCHCHFIRLSGVRKICHSTMKILAWVGFAHELGVDRFWIGGGMNEVA